MIHPSNLTEVDKGRKIIYHREFCKRQEGVLSSWNSTYVFVRFNGPNGEACDPADVTFTLPIDLKEQQLVIKESK